MSIVNVRLVRKPAVLLANGTLGGDVRIAPTVTESAIADERSALIRARAELDASVQRVGMSATIPAPTRMVPGTIGRLIDRERGPVAAKLTAITYRISISDDRALTADADLSVERIDD